MSNLQPGDQAPRFTAETDEGETIKLDDFAGKKVILYFYPKDDTSGCTTQACGFRDGYDDVILPKNAVVLGVSPDNATSHRKFKQKFDLPFTLLVDSDHNIAELYKVWGEKSMYGKKYMGITRSHFVIDENGKILDAQYKVSPKDSVTRSINSINQGISND